MKSVFFFLLSGCSKLFLCIMPIAQIAIGEWVYACSSIQALVSPSYDLRQKWKCGLSDLLLSPMCPTGSVYLHDCPRQRYVPIYLIVVGTFGLVLALLSCLPCAQEPKDGTSNPLSQVCTVWNSLTSFFLFCWFIAGEFERRSGGEWVGKQGDSVVFDQGNMCFWLEGVCLSCVLVYLQHSCGQKINHHSEFTPVRLNINTCQGDAI